MSNMKLDDIQISDVDRSIMAAVERGIEMGLAKHPGYGWKKRLLDHLVTSGITALILAIGAFVFREISTINDSTQRAHDRISVLEERIKGSEELSNQSFKFLVDKLSRIDTKIDVLDDRIEISEKPNKPISPEPGQDQIDEKKDRYYEDWQHEQRQQMVAPSNNPKKRGR